MADEGELRDLLREYFKLTRVISRADEMRGVVKARLKRKMESRGVDVLRSGDLRALLYPVRKVDWDLRELGGVLERAGVPDEVAETVFVQTVNEDALNDLVDKDLVELKDVHSAGKVRTTWGFRVDKVGGSD